jgi:hypothetical protein
MFLTYTLCVHIVSFNDKTYTNYSHILLHTFIRFKNTLPNRQETTFLSDICVFLSGRRKMDKPIKITNGEFRLICLSYRAKEPCTDYAKFLFSHSTLRRKI